MTEHELTAIAEFPLLTVGSSGRENEYLLRYPLSLASLAVLAEFCVMHSFMDEIKNNVLVQVPEQPEHQHMREICSEM